MKIRLVIFFFVVNFFCSWSAFTQNTKFDEILNKKDLEKIALLEAWAYEELYFKDPVERIKLLNQFEILAKKKKDDIALRNIAFYRAYYVIALDSKNPDLGLQKMNQIILEAEASSNTLQAAYFRHVVGYYYFTEHKKYIPALQNMLTAHYEFEKVGYEKIYDPSTMLDRLAYLYFHLNNYNESIYYLNKCLKFPISNPRKRMGVLNAIGQSYREILQADSAEYFMKKSRELAFKQKDTSWIVINSNDISKLFFKTNKINEASFFVMEAYEHSKNVENDILKAEVLINLGKLELLKGNEKKALTFLNLADSLFASQNKLPYEDYKRKLYFHKTYAEVFENLGDFNKAFKNIQIADFITDSINKRSSMSKNVTINQYFKNKHNEEKIKKVTYEKELEVLKNKITLFFLIIFLIVAILYYRNFKRKKRIVLLDKERLAIKNRQKEKELHETKNLLEDYFLDLKEKNNLLEVAQNELQNFKNSDSEIDPYLIIQNLKQSVILTEDDWVNFKNLFEKVHVGFYTKLRSKYPNLTPGEIRLLSLIKLDLSSHEIANALGISIMGVKKNRQRLRKKLNLTEDEKLEKLIEEL